jgi:hypothetical protein
MAPSLNVCKYQMAFVYQHLTRTGERLPALAIRGKRGSAAQKAGELADESSRTLQPLDGALASKGYHNVEHSGSDCLSG